MTRKERKKRIIADSGQRTADRKRKLYAKRCTLNAASGFTMIELMAMLIIIGLLATLVVTKVASKIDQARERILAGADIATPLRDSGVIDPAIAHMVAVGEKSGELEKMLKNISDNLEASTDIVIERLSAAVEPLIIIIMAAIVGVIAYATILPILEVSAGKF